MQEKFAYGELLTFVMIGYIFIVKMVKKNAKFRLRNSSWVNTSLKTNVTLAGSKTEQNTITHVQIH